MTELDVTERTDETGVADEVEMEKVEFNSCKTILGDKL